MTVSLESLFGDLDLSEGETVLDGMGFTSASELLTHAGQSTSLTRPYEIPGEELSLWGDDSRTTTPVSFDELPAEAYPTQVNLFIEE